MACSLVVFRACRRVAGSGAGKVRSEGVSGRWWGAGFISAVGKPGTGPGVRSLFSKVVVMPSMSDRSSDTSSHRFELRNPGKVLFPEAGITKKDLCAYYAGIAEKMLPYLQGRAVMMERYPDGIQEEGFFQKQVPDYFPEWISRAAVRKKDGFVIQPVVDHPEALCYLAAQGCIVLHVALAPVSSPDKADRLVFDLDPSGPDFSLVRQAALALRQILQRMGLAVFCKTTGSRGLHVEVPLDGQADFKRTRAFAKAIARFVVKLDPDNRTLAIRKSERSGRVFIDCLRNGYAQTTVAPYSVRARKGAPVAAPVSWQEVGQEELTPDKYNMGNILRIIGGREDPWANFHTSSRPLPDLARLG